MGDFLKPLPGELSGPRIPSPGGPQGVFLVGLFIQRDAALANLVAEAAD